jgi:hypothetical protein
MELEYSNDAGVNWAAIGSGGGGGGSTIKVDGATKTTVDLTDSTDVAVSISGEDVTFSLPSAGDWNTAYSWGNHGTAGYLKAEVDGSTTNELPLAGNDIDVTSQTVAIEGELNYVTKIAPTGSLELSPTGNVGIGSAVPAKKLDVSGNIGTTTRVDYSNGTVAGYTGIDGTNLDIGSTSNHDVRVETNGTVRAVFTAAGNIGLGTTNPVQILDIGSTAATANKIRIAGNTSGAVLLQTQGAQGTPTLTFPTTSGTFATTASGALSLNATTGALTHSTSAGSIHIPTGGTVSQLPRNSASGTLAWSSVVVDANGNMGIGSTSPTVPLSIVAGTNVITGTLLGGNSNTYLQYKVKNAQTGNLGSGDFVIESSAGSETSNFLDLGKNNPSFSDAAFTIVGGNSGYLYNDVGDMAVGTSQNNYVSIFTGGTLAANERMRVTGTGNVGIGTTAPTASLDVNGVVKTSATNIRGTVRHLRVAIKYPASAYAAGVRIPLMITDGAITFTSLKVTLDADPTTEINANLKYADALIGLANATVINDIDTTAGVRDDSSMTSGSVASGKTVYLEMDASPDPSTVDLLLDAVYVYD